MQASVILLSGPVASGKSTLGRMLAAGQDDVVLSTRALLTETLRRAGREVHRAALRVEGERIERESGGSWVLDRLNRQLEPAPPHAVVVVDAIRTRFQIDLIKAAHGPRVVHVHVSASYETRARRYAERGAAGDHETYAAVSSTNMEAEATGLEGAADIVLNSERQDAETMLRIVEGHLARGDREWPVVHVVECQVCGASHCVAVHDLARDNRIYVEDASVWPNRGGEPDAYCAGDCPEWDRALGEFQERTHNWRTYTKGFYPEGWKMEKPTIAELRARAARACRFDEPA